MGHRLAAPAFGMKAPALAQKRRAGTLPAHRPDGLVCLYSEQVPGGPPSGYFAFALKRDHPKNQKGPMASERGQYPSSLPFGLRTGCTVLTGNLVDIKGFLVPMSDIEEREANLFAMELLMPRAFLLADIEKMGGVDIEDDAAMTKLAKRYKVSVTIMAIRLGQ